MEIDAATGNAITDTLTAPDGTYNLRSVAGNYYVVVQPLANTSLTTGVASINNFHGWACGYSTTFSSCSGVPANAINYTGKYY